MAAALAGRASRRRQTICGTCPIASRNQLGGNEFAHVSECQRTFAVAASLARRPGRRLAGESRLGREIIATEAPALLARAPVFTARPRLRSHLTTRRHVRVGVV